MSPHSAKKLPLGWEWSEGQVLQDLQAEYDTELPEVHPLYEVEIDVVAHRDGNDDILVRHKLQDNRVSVVHLSWAQKRELANHPSVEFTGTHEEFLQWEFDTYGVGTSDP